MTEAMIERLAVAMDAAAAVWCNRPPYDKPKELFSRHIAAAMLEALTTFDLAELAKARGYALIAVPRRPDAEADALLVEAAEHVG